MDTERTPDDILLRLSLLEGFTLLHLRRLRAALREPFLPGLDQPGCRTILRKGAAAIDSRDAGERAARVRDACLRAGIRIVCAGSGEYPLPLRDVPDAPLVLYLMGATPPDASLAVVGSRAPTAPGAEFARILARDLAMAGWAVVSGLARGIDTAAHVGALLGGGRTYAVLGCGVDVVYPQEARSLRARILDGRGGLVSEYPPGTPPLAHHFPARNRIISGLSRGVIVAEAAARSGALITARRALDQGREVMAVPGNPLFPHTRGSNGLLRDGAAPVTGAEDVLAALGRPSPPAAAEPGATASAGARGLSGGVEERILRFLSTERHVDEIAQSLRMPVPDLLPRLLDMELAKLLERRPGDYYKKMSDIRS